MAAPEPAQSGPARGAFVGRGRELAELRAALDEVGESQRHLFLVSGEPGIGKTRLVDELAADARARRFGVMWGRCWEGGGAPAYWPWISNRRAAPHTGLHTEITAMWLWNHEYTPVIKLP